MGTLASKIATTAVTLAGAVAPVYLWIGNPNLKPIDEGWNFLVPIIACSVSAGIGYLIYRGIHYCRFDLARDLASPRNSSSYKDDFPGIPHGGHQGDMAWRDAGFEEQQNSDDNSR